jgi:hypothetical protein
VALRTGDQWRSRGPRTRLTECADLGHDSIVANDLVILAIPETAIMGIGAFVAWRYRTTGIGVFPSGFILFGSILLGMLTVVGLVGLLLVAIGA